MEHNNDAQNHLTGLNSRQKEAVLATEGALLILAGAGAGKTKTITHRILHIIKGGARPSAVLAITFTNKSASEMRERVRALLLSDAALNRPMTMDEMPFVSTFHSLGVKIIKDNSHLLNLPRHFSIFDRGDSKLAVKNALLAADIDPKEFDPGKVLNLISRQKGDGVSSSDFEMKEEKSFFEDIAARAWIEYEKILAKEKALDFDDLLLKTLWLLKKDEIAEKYWKLWQYIHIDEYQDTNRVQYDIAKRLAQKSGNIAVVGDIDQCLIAGTKITMADGTNKAIEKVGADDIVLSNYGSGDYRGARVTEVFKKSFKGDTITITTASGKHLTSTPKHLHFAGFKLGPSSQRYFTYLMYKREKGFRLGVSQTYTKGLIKPVPGFMQRCNQEHADKLWIIASHDNPNNARILEYSLSMRFGIPTIPFVARKGNGSAGNGIVHDQKIIDAIFKACNTEEAGNELIKEYGLDRMHPHHSAQSKNSNRRNITITLCGDHRGKTPMHRIAMVGNDKEGKRKLESIGLSVRPAKANSTSWRFETAHSDYGVLMKIVSRIATVFTDLEIIRNARLGGKKSNPRDGNSLPFLPAASLMAGMIVFDDEGRFDIVEKVERKTISKTMVYDLNIERTHNFIANGIVTHNSIYSWRGADFKNIMRFEKDYKDAKTILLEENYRSTKTILTAANAVIAKNIMRKDKNLFTENKDGDMISLYIAFDERDEAGTIAEKTDKLIRNGTPVDEIAVLYRANFQSRAIEEAFIRRRISYELLGTKFFERKEVKDALSYIKAALNPDSLSDLKRIINTPARGIGKVTMLKVLEGKENELPAGTREKILNLRQILGEIKVAAESKVPSEAVKFAIQRSGLEQMLMLDKEEGAERLENVRELVSTAGSYDMYGVGDGMEKFLEHSALSSDQDDLGKTGGVKLMTVHASKGLEFEHVFVSGLEQDLFPHEKMSEGEISLEDKEEERRLFYVALTRAKEKLHLSYAQTRTIYGSRQVNAPSEFLSDIDDSLMHLENPEAEKMMQYIDF